MKQTHALTDTFNRVRPAVVALISRMAPSHSGQPPLFPPIIGTGFFVDPRGLLLTNRHVIEVLEKFPRHPVTGKSPAAGVVLVEATTKGGPAFGCIFVDVKRWWVAGAFHSKSVWYGESLPDLAIVQLNVADTPALKLTADPESLKIGMPIATMGFPMGETPLLLYDKITQIAPLLRKGIISGLFPFPCSNPHGFAIDVMSQGGASGSPVFYEDEPTVVGMIHCGFPQTNITAALPSGLIQRGFNQFLKNNAISVKGVPTLDSYACKEPKSSDFTWSSFQIDRSSTEKP